MSTQTQILLEQEVLDLDIHDIAAAFGNDVNGLQECMGLIQEELDRIGLHPVRQGKDCEYEPLKSAGYRKVKLYSSKALRTTKGEKPDLRIIYKYDEADDMVRVVSIGFRAKEKPRPDHDPYSKATKREKERQQV
ncbi:hypothetical protein ACFSL6_03215 [Paenibacillus thailandensis]|uniref:Transposase n=1 Tax=Paenibacillus thailandensis TaxID=393250 RepID=A0ABW5R4H1_9BACL